jgi:hypothetical protein
MRLAQTILCIGLIAAAPMAIAEEFSNTPKQETLAQAIQFEKYKVAAAEAQAKKDAAEAAAKSRPAQSQTAKASKAARKAGQADSASKK